jgi:hypothetical protein
MGSLNSTGLRTLTAPVQQRQRPHAGEQRAEPHGHRQQLPQRKRHAVHLRVTRGHTAVILSRLRCVADACQTVCEGVHIASTIAPYRCTGEPCVGLERMPNHLRHEVRHERHVGAAEQRVADRRAVVVLVAHEVRQRPLCHHAHTHRHGVEQHRRHQHPHMHPQKSRTCAPRGDWPG